jgi:hypothetical protein
VAASRIRHAHSNLPALADHLHRFPPPR